VPAHGEGHHLSVHAAFAKARGVEQTIGARNGDIVRLLPGVPAVVGKAPTGRLLKDGEVLISEDDGAVRERARLGFAGVVSLALAIDKRGDLVGDPDVLMSGLPKKGRDGEDMGEVVDDAIFRTFDNLPRQKRRDFDAAATAIERAVRSSVNAVWGKKPQVHVLIIEA
jgi:ribonuclease J